MLSTRVRRRGQVVLPKEVLMKLKVAEGDRIAFVIDDDRIVIKPMTHTLFDLRGRVTASSKQDFDSIRNQVKIKRSQNRES